MQNGFKGKASMIEVYGTDQEVKKITDSSTFRAGRQDERQYDSKSSSREKTASRIKSLEKKRSTLLLYLLIPSVFGLIIWMAWGLWKRRGWR